MNKRPASNQWRLTDRQNTSQNYGRDFIFDFNRINTLDLREATKEYIWINNKYAQRRLKGLKEFYRGILIIDEFMTETDCTLKDFNNDDADALQSFLANYISISTGRIISHSYQRNCFSELKSLIRWCQAYYPDRVNAGAVFTGNEYRQNYNRLKIDYIPDDILEKIDEAVAEEPNIYLKCGIIILRNTGMRIGDLMLLQRDCMKRHPINGKMLQWYDHKCQRLRRPIPINSQCAKVIEMLISESEKLSRYARASEKKNLFLYKPDIGTNTNPVVTVSKQVFTKWCADFCKRHDIRDNSGELYKLTTHQFRRTLGTDMFSNGANLKVIQEVLGHASPTTTKMYYADVKDSSEEAMFKKIGVLGDIGSAIENNVFDNETSEYLRTNKDGCAKLIDGYCTLPIRNGQPCSKLMSRWKCYRCSRYITTISDLDTHREELRNLEELLESNIYGAHYAAHLIPSILALKEIIRRLEELKDE